MARPGFRKAIVLEEEDLELFLDRGASVFLTYHYLKGIEEGEEVFLCSAWTDDVALPGVTMPLNLYYIRARANFVGNRFVPAGSVPHLVSYHGLSVAEYELQRRSWPQSFLKRDGAVGWQLDVVELMQHWVSVKDVTTEAWQLDALSGYFWLRVTDRQTVKERGRGRSAVAVAVCSP